MPPSPRSPDLPRTWPRTMGSGRIRPGESISGATATTPRSRSSNSSHRQPPVWCPVSMGMWAPVPGVWTSGCSRSGRERWVAVHRCNKPRCAHVCRIFCLYLTFLVLFLMLLIQVHVSGINWIFLIKIFYRTQVYKYNQGSLFRQSYNFLLKLKS